ncbi:MAG: extracellular solute-binding protein [Anaerolineae bacterium]|nr:extracellular solute-binding protein [Anaerolineae bacterium]MDW8070093.1 extracellular solute-binding protein [Anaerolineae bacterium]
MRKLNLLLACLLITMLVALTTGIAQAQTPEQPWKGKTVTVLVIAEGPKAGISGPFYHFREEWENLTGAKLEIAEFPFGELHEKIFTDLTTGAGKYDIFVIGTWEYGDLVAGDWIVPIDQFYGDPRFPEWPKDLAPSVELLYTWGGTWYGVPNDSDGQILYYRKDILTDPKWQAEFKKEKGYDLPVPPETWDQLYDITSFFNGKDWDGDGEADSGISMHLKVGGQGMFHFMSLSAPFVVLPGDKVDNVHNTYWFDFETMEPLINSPGHVRALEFLQKLAKTGPDAQLGWTLGEAWDYFLRGKAIATFSWGDVGSLAQDPERSKIKGKLGCSILPGVYEVYDRSVKDFVKLEKPNVVGNTTGGTWHGVISKLSKNPDLAYHLLSFHATVEKSRYYAYHGWEGVDIGRKNQFIEPYGTNTIEGFLEAGWDKNDILEYNKAYYDNFYAKTILPYLRIPGAFEYWTSLDQHLSEAMTGALSAQEALDRVAEDYRNITERLGVEDQLRYYRESMGYAGQ